MKTAILFLLFYPFISIAQTATDDSLFIHNISVSILGSDAYYNNLHYLTKNIGGRLAGSPQMVKAEQWGANAMKEAGAETVTIQECNVPHWVRGGNDKAFVTYKDEQGRNQTYTLNILALGNSIGSGKAGVQAPLYVSII